MKYKRNTSISLILISYLIAGLCYGQTIKPTTAEERLNSFKLRKQMNDKSILNNIRMTNIGPTVMSGRAVAVCVNPTNENEFYVAYASGGLWHTTNNGQTFRPLFDNEDAITIGDIEVDWFNGQVIWIGTGENNSSRSSYAGTGIYCSLDIGKTWIHKGLSESHHIGKIIINPKNSKILWVAVLGHLYSYNAERGIYKTTDGGTTWNKILFVDDSTGFIDLAMDPSNENILYASAWHRERKPWDFIESGSKSAIYKTIDGGTKWANISNNNSGFPLGRHVGRIGLSISASNPSTIYAIVDNQGNQEKKMNEKYTLTAAKLRKMTNAAFVNLDSTTIQAFINNNEFLKTETVAYLKSQVTNNKLSLIQIADYVSNANNDLFDTPVIGAEIYRSNNSGLTWTKTNQMYLDGCYNSYGYYFGKIKVSPFNEKEIYVMGVPLLKSINGGASFVQIDNDNVHGDHHFLWMNSNKKGHMINCNDGGLNMSYDAGKNWSKLNSPAVGQIYAINVDDKTPYNVYCGLQDNGVWMGSSNCNPNNKDWEQEGQNCFKRIMGGDGMQIQIDKRDNAIFCGYQFGNYYRLLAGAPAKYLHPKSKLGESSLRYCWQTPILLSTHCPEILFMGSNKLHRSLDRGNSFETINKDLTNGFKQGDVPYGTITCIAESPLKFGTLYLGTDDGRVWVSTDLGNTFTDISNGLARGLRVMKISPSMHNENLVYVALSGFQFDNFEPYLFKSENKGQTWTNIAKDKLPYECINVVKEDLLNSAIIYVGTDNGLYVSFNKGITFDGFKQLPRVAVHDLIVQPKANELVIGTHGRSMYTCNLAEISKINDSIKQCDLFVFETNQVTYRAEWGKKYAPWDIIEEPVFTVPIYSKKSEAIFAKLCLNDMVIKEVKLDLTAGLNYPTIAIQLNKVEKEMLEKNQIKLGGENNNYLNIGKYKLKLITSKGNYEIPLEIKE